MVVKFALLIYAASGIWAASEDVPLWFTIGLGSLLTAMRFLPALSSPPSNDNDPAVRSISSFGRFIPLLALASPLIYFALTFRQEFPFGMDHAFHFASLLDISSFWKRWFLPVFIVSIVYVKYGNRFRSSDVLFYVFLVVLGRFVLIPASAIRYPGLAYFFGVPWAVMLKLFGLDYLATANRIGSLCAILGWGVIRQRLWPKSNPMRGVFFALLFFFQKEIAFYFTSAYIEPWGIAFALLSFEALLEKSKDYTQAFVFLAAASMCKEYCFIFFPLVFLATLLNAEKKIFPWACDCAVATFPFLTYLLVRSHHQINRSVGLTLTPWRFKEGFWQGVRYELFVQHGVGGIVLISILCVLIISGCYLVKKRSWYRDSQFISILAVSLATFQIAGLFFFDRVSAASSPGFSRFNLLPYALLCLSGASVLAIFLNGKPTYIKLSVGGTLLAVNLWTLIPFLHQVTKPSYLASDAFMQMDRPHFFPIRELILQAKAQSLIKEGDSIQIQVIEPPETGPDHQIGFSHYSFYYPELRQFKLVDHEPYECSCKRHPVDAVFASIQYQPKLKGTAMFGFRAKHISNCVEKLKQDCATVLPLTSPDGELIAAIGITSR